MSWTGAVFRRSVISGRDRMGASKDLVDCVDRSCRAPIAARDRSQPIQEGVLRMSRLEAGRRSEVVSIRIDELATGERCNHVRRPMSEPERGHVDEGAVVGLERHPQVELEDAVAAEERPVPASRQHLSAEPRTLEDAVPYQGNNLLDACTGSGQNDRSGRGVPGRHWSLWDIMNHFRAETICAICGQLQIVIGGCQFAIGQGHPGHPVEPELLQMFTEMVPKTGAFLAEVGLKESRRQLDLAIQSTKLKTLNVSVLRTSLLTIQDTLFS